MKKSQNLLEHARQLRKEMTKQERKLWYDFLRDYPVKIYKQKIIANYIVDFYCHSAKLVIEIDGGQHYTAEGVEYDKVRTDILESIGLRVVRFTNHEVNDNFGEVCRTIAEDIALSSSAYGATSPSPTAPPPP